MSGVKPSPSVTGSSPGEQRHQLAIAPHVRRAVGQRFLLPRPRRLEIVAGQHRQLARRAQEMSFARIEGPRAAPAAALEVREVAICQAAPGLSCACRSSIILMCASVTFCTSSSARFSSSSEILWSFSIFLSLSLASRRTTRTWLRPSSAILWTWRDSSLRRSSVSDGIGMRSTLPSLGGIEAEVRQPHRRARAPP